MLFQKHSKTTTQLSLNRAMRIRKKSTTSKREIVTMYFVKMIRFLLRDLQKIDGKMMNSSNHYSFN